MSAYEVDGYEDVPLSVLYEGEPQLDPEPAEVAREVDDEPPGPSVPASFTDAHVAEVLAEHLAGRWLYVAAWGRWLRWDGTRWAADVTEAIYEEARRWAVEMVATVARVGASSEDVKRAASYRNRRKLDDVLTMARRVRTIAAEPDSFDRNPDVLNVANGTIELRTGRLRPHDPGDRITRLAPVDYIADAYHPDVAELLKVVAPDVHPWLRKFIGYAATGHTSEDVVAVWDGAGANAKSTFLEAVSWVLGDYASAVSPQLVMRTSHEPHPTIKADLMGRRLVWISETEEGGAFRMEQVKALTGGDQIAARFMRGDFFTFTPTHTLVIATNHRPTVNSTEHAAWRRLRLVPFPYTYKPAHEAAEGDRVQDPKMRHRLATGHPQREALLAWIIDGARRWYAEGLGTCPTIAAATERWRAAEDVIVRFIHECCTLEPGASTRGRELYTAYTDWCVHEGRRPKSNKNFAQEFMAHEVVTAANVTKVDRQRVAFYEGVKVRDVASF